MPNIAELLPYAMTGLAAGAGYADPRSSAQLASAWLQAKRVKGLTDWYKDQISTRKQELGLREKELKLREQYQNILGYQAAKPTDAERRLAYEQKAGEYIARVLSEADDLSKLSKTDLLRGMLKEKIPPSVASDALENFGLFDTASGKAAVWLTNDGTLLTVAGRDVPPEAIRIGTPQELEDPMQRLVARQEIAKRIQGLVSQGVGKDDPRVTGLSQALKVLNEEYGETDKSFLDRAREYLITTPEEEAIQTLGPKRYEMLKQITGAAPSTPAGTESERAWRRFLGRSGLSEGQMPFERWQVLYTPEFTRISQNLIKNYVPKRDLMGNIEKIDTTQKVAKFRNWTQHVAATLADRLPREVIDNATLSLLAEFGHEFEQAGDIPWMVIRDKIVNLLNTHPEYPVKEIYSYIHDQLEQFMNAKTVEEKKAALGIVD